MNEHGEGVVTPLTDWLAPVTLTGRFIRLEPLTEQHAEGVAHHADAQTVAWLSRGGPAELSVQGWADHIRQLNALPNRVNWAVVVRAAVMWRVMKLSGESPTVPSRTQTGG